MKNEQSQEIGRERNQTQRWTETENLIEGISKSENVCTYSWVSMQTVVLVNFYTIKVIFILYQAKNFKVIQSYE